MVALKAAVLALLAALGSAQSPSCIDTDATVRAFVGGIRPTGSLATWLARSLFALCVQFIEVVDVLETARTPPVINGTASTLPGEPTPLPTTVRILSNVRGAAGNGPAGLA